jgi:hypothetical protein
MIKTTLFIISFMYRIDLVRAAVAAVYPDAYELNTPFGLKTPDGQTSPVKMVSSQVLNEINNKLEDILSKLEDSQVYDDINNKLEDILSKLEDSQVYDDINNKMEDILSKLEDVETYLNDTIEILSSMGGSTYNNIMIFFIFFFLMGVIAIINIALIELYGVPPRNHLLTNNPIKGLA